MSDEPKSKSRDSWDKLEIIGKGIVIPLTVALFTILTNRSLSEISERLKVGEQDIGLMKTFKEIYYGEDSKRLAVSFTARISDKRTREQLQTFVIWDTLERRITASSPPGFKFDPEESDWHMFGDTVWERYLKASEKKELPEFVDWWTLYIKEAAYRRWPEKSELVALFLWVEATYLQSDRLPTDGPITKKSLERPQEEAMQLNAKSS